jgi:putative membrane-bound dehydrogenase-like protein
MNAISLMRRFTLYIVLIAVVCITLTASHGDDIDPQPVWHPRSVPGVWKNLTGEDKVSSDGYCWFRCLVDVPDAWQGRQLELFVEAADDAREAYFNGQRVGGVGTFPPEYRSGLGVTLRFAVESGTVVFGEPNVVALRICQQNSRPNFNVAAPVLFAGDEAIRLNGTWENAPGDNSAWSRLSARSEINTQAKFATRENAVEILADLKRLEGGDGPLAIDEALRKIKVPEDLTLELAVGEPHIGQPLSIKWDERGRLWVMQYLQYPNPAGLTMVSRDQHLRAVYDKVPAPPPHHFPGTDKITIHTDSDGDGHYDQHHTFVEGLSLATSFAIGRGGIFVLNPPYLLFYPDRDHDDHPDGDPEVLLEGFGLEDSHSIANSLQWGPDGWLYGCMGSTVSGDIRRYGSDDPPLRSMGQQVWRYHPQSRTYEIFAEGGGNTFGLEIDSKGRIFSGNNGGNTRGFHYVQGGYYRKGFGKHGQLANPYTFGYFEAMVHHDAPRFTHVFAIYEGAALPARYNGRLFSAAPLQSELVLSRLEPDRSSFKTTDEGRPMKSTDPWFRPVDVKVGPDGGVYIADMYEQRIDHASHYQGRIHRESGRVWRLRGNDQPEVEPFDLSQRSSTELVEFLRHENKWFRQTALRLFADRHDATIIPELTIAIDQATGQFALETLWALHLSGGLNDERSIVLLDHTDPFVRLWTVRLACDDGTVSPAFATRLAQLAVVETDLEARSQLACSARRLPAADGLPIVRALLQRGEDVDDIHMRLLLWWAIEAWAESDRPAVVEMFSDPGLWDAPIVTRHIIQRMMRRYAAAGKRPDLLACATLLRAAPRDEHAQSLMAGFEEALQGRPLTALPAELVASMAARGGGSLALRVRQGDEAAVEEALRSIADDQADQALRVRLIQALSDTRPFGSLASLLHLAAHASDTSVRAAVLGGLQSFDDSQIAEHILALHGDLPDDLREPAQTLLSRRRSWSRALLGAVDAGQVPADQISLDVIRKMLLHRDEQIDSIVKQHWGDVAGATTDEMLADIERVAHVILTGSGIPPRGKPLFQQSCAKCHRLFNEGGNIGPDLTGFKRDDLRRMLVNVINPSIEIRAGYETYVVHTEDGRALTGFIADQDDHVVVLTGADGQRLIISREDIDEMAAIKRSLMPEGLLQSLDDQQLRDLFAYLRASQPVQ